MDILKMASELSEAGKPFMLATVLSVSGSSPARPGFRMIVPPEGRIFGTIGGGALEKSIIDEAKKALAGADLPEPELKKIDLGMLNMECGGSVEIFIEYFGGRRDFILFGGGHVGQALARLLEQLDYSVTIFDNRPGIQAAAEAPGRGIIIADYSDISPAAELLRTSRGCFIATHGHEWDRKVLTQVIRTAPRLPYIGMIGSKRKVKASLDALKAEGIEIPANLYAPVGLKIGADSASEIALSVAAEITAVKNNMPVPHMRTEIEGV